MNDNGGLESLSERLRMRSGVAATAAWDSRIDGMVLTDASPGLLLHVRHQALLRAYQMRYVVLPEHSPAEAGLAALRRHYDRSLDAELSGLRFVLEDALIAPQVEAARASAAGGRLEAYVEAMQHHLGAAPENAFVAYLRTSKAREDHYRNFLLQSSVDLLAEASASAFGVIGEFGQPQSALFRILIDEFGYGSHPKKHSVLYRALMRDFGLPEEYNACWPLFDTAALSLHNTIHYLFQNPGHIFLQIGFLLFAETAYQRSTRDHFRYLSEFHPQADARYFSEHAHIDLHHSRMIVEEVALPMVETFGPEAGEEIIAGAELTRRAFETAGDQLLGASRAFDDAFNNGVGAFLAPDASDLAALGRLVTPDRPGGAAALQIGGIGRLSDPEAFAVFPAGTVGRTLGAGQ